VGDPIAHSLSPVLHRAAYAENDLTWIYQAHQVPHGGLVDFVDRIRTEGEWRGLSCTMPLKREALALADQPTDRAVAARAANTLIFEDGRVLADNTDIPGAVSALRERFVGSVDRVAIMGGGATAGSMLLAMASQGCREITLMVRDPARATATRQVAQSIAGLRLTVTDLARPISADLLISTIPASAQSEDLVRRTRDVPVVFDVTYHPWPTPIAAAGLADARTVVGGLDLLVHQAGLQFEAFARLPAPLRQMRAAAEAALGWRTL